MADNGGDHVVALNGKDAVGLLRELLGGYDPSATIASADPAAGAPARS